MTKRMLSLVLALFLALPAMGVLAEPAFDKPAELIWYGNGSPTDNERVVEQMNAILQERYNTTLKPYYIGWNDWQSQYNLLLTSGETIDLIYVNSYIYSRYAPSGAFLDLTELFPALMPQTAAYFSAEDLNEFAVDGRIYGVPSSMRSYIPYGIFYRSDLLEKYDLAPIDSMETFEAYMDAIAANEKDMLPYQGDPSQPFLRMFRAYTGFELVAGDHTSVANIVDYDDPNSITAYPFTEEYLAWAHRMKDYADRGYWSSNALSSTLSTFDTVQVGTSAISIENPDGVAKLVTTIAPVNPSFAFDYWCFSDLAGYALPNTVLHDAFAIPVTSKNAERTLTVVEAIKTDSDLFDLWMYGIKGYHYDVAEDGRILTPAAGQDPSVSFNGSSLTWFMRVESLMRRNVNEWEGLPALQERIRAKGIRNQYGAVTLDYADVQPELAAVNQVMQQYGLPIEVGLVADVDAAVAEYRQKLTEAGVDKLVASIRDQVMAYRALKGIE